MDWRDTGFVVLDTETSALHPDTGGRVLEFGVVIFKERDVVDQYSHLLFYDGEIAPGASRVSGIYSKHVNKRTLPSFVGMWMHVVNMLPDDFPILAYNSPFDARFLQMELRNAKFLPMAGQATWAREKQPWVDVYPFIKEMDSDSCKLVNACARRGISIERAHRAVDDAVATGRLACTLDLPDTVEATLARQQYLKTEQAYLRACGKGYKGPRGVTFFCAACNQTSWSKEKRRLPQKPRPWSYYAEEVTCSATCHSQMRWWDARSPKDFL